MIYRRQSGVILPLTLVMLAIIATMATMLTTNSQRAIREATVAKDHWQAKLAIHNAEQRVLYAMLTGEQQPGAYQLGQTTLQTDGTPAQLSNGVWVSVQDQAGLLGLTFINRSQMHAVLRGFLGEPSASNLTRQLINWQKEQQSDIDTYLNQENAPRGALFRSLDEVMLIPGMTPELYNGQYWDLANQKAPNGSEGSPVPGFRDLFVLRGAAEPNLAATPPYLLNKLYGFNQEDIARLQEQKARANWRGVEFSLRTMGVPVAQENFIPGKFYSVRFQYQTIQARGEFEINSYLLPTPRITWYYPDLFRFVENNPGSR
ncbi:TPA: general secretion pathway protein GspK [Vibrio vulnificus]|nr:hypothetical protein [Vibrio vulnificus]HDY7995277.1 general secretion pathway protein GspK [Vibrio vulnificus]HDY8106585.1 general secretion pathway protein GspK [Vibrio vulnificus]